MIKMFELTTIIGVILIILLISKIQYSNIKDLGEFNKRFPHYKDVIDEFENKLGYRNEIDYDKKIIIWSWYHKSKPKCIHIIFCNNKLRIYTSKSSVGINPTYYVIENTIKWFLEDVK